MRHSSLVAFMFVAACGGGGMSEIADDQPGDDAQPLGRCTQLDGRTFSSVEIQPDCGLGPDGPVPCNWRIEFTNDGAQYTGWTWYHSDVGQSGDIRCSGTDIVTITDGTAEMHTASYDADTEHLTWDGIEYAPTVQ